MSLSRFVIADAVVIVTIFYVRRVYTSCYYVRLARGEVGEQCVRSDFITDSTGCQQCSREYKVIALRSLPERALTPAVVAALICDSAAASDSDVFH